MGALDVTGPGATGPGSTGPGATGRGADAGDPTLEPGGLLDVLGVAAVLLDDQGRITLWSPQAEKLFGYPAAEALGRPADRLLVQARHVELVRALFAQVMGGGGAWAGAFPVRRKDGATRLVEFRNMRLEDERGRHYALVLASDRATLRRIERDLALTLRLVEQSPIGLTVLDTDLRYVLVNPAIERVNGLPAAATLGRTVREALPFLDADAIESAMCQVLETGRPILDHFTLGRTPADPGCDHAWSSSYYRLEGPIGGVLGVAVTVVDVTEQHPAAQAAAVAHRRLAVLAEASERIGTTLDLDRTARELAEVLVRGGGPARQQVPLQREGDLPLALVPKGVVDRDGRAGRDLVETREHDIDARLRTLLDLLDRPVRSLERTCDLLLAALAHDGGRDDVALLLARTCPLQPPDAG